MTVRDEVISIIKNVLNLNEDGINRESRLLGEIPEFDSQAVLAIITQVEEQFGVYFEDDEISAEIFESVGTLSAFVEQKL